jgi:hypothetical protein
MRRCILIALVLVVGAQATMLIGRSGAVLKPLQAFGWLNMGTNRWAKGYDWDSLKYVELGTSSQRSNTFVDANVMLGLPGKLELGLNVPLAMKSQDTFSSSGVGDVMALGRLGLLQSPLLPVKAALCLGVSLPTAKEGALPPLGNRTLDLGLGLSVVTSRFGPLAAHARLGYWLPGKADSITRRGNMLEYQLVADAAVGPKVSPQLALSGLMQGQTKVDDIEQENTEASLHALNVLLLTKPLPFLVVRPKVAFPLEGMSKGSYIPSIYWGLDIWATLP